MGVMSRTTQASRTGLFCGYGLGASNVISILFVENNNEKPKRSHQLIALAKRKDRVQGQVSFWGLLAIPLVSTNGKARCLLNRLVHAHTITQEASSFINHQNQEGQKGNPPLLRPLLLFSILKCVRFWCTCLCFVVLLFSLLSSD